MADRMWNLRRRDSAAVWHSVETQGPSTAVLVHWHERASSLGMTMRLRRLPLCHPERSRGTSCFRGATQCEERRRPRRRPWNPTLAASRVCLTAGGLLAARMGHPAVTRRGVRLRPRIKGPMGRAIEIPITPSVLRWAIAESGYAHEDVARAVGVESSVLRSWTSGESSPTLSHARKLAGKLHRPLAALLLPAPPENRPVAVEFRHPQNERRDLNVDERRYIRRASRLQEIMSWISRGLQLESAQTPLASAGDDPAAVATVIREFLKVDVSQQREWQNPAIAFDRWRESLERYGHLVFLFSLGKESSQGFSLWDEFAPLVAVNTAWNESARIFTMFHEFGHLVTRTSSACLEPRRTSSRTDPLERWCEQFAASVLMPTRDVQATLRGQGWHSGVQVTDLSLAKRLASLYKVSLRASVIRMIEIGAATWALYDQIPPISDAKPAGGGGKGRSRIEIREDQLGDRASFLFVEAVNREILDRSQAIEFLDIPEVTFDALAEPPAGRPGE
jgi:Zn-dependent peptidase ImmA (M78 family)